MEIDAHSRKRKGIDSKTASTKAKVKTGHKNSKMTREDSAAFRKRGEESFEFLSAQNQPIWIPMDDDPWGPEGYQNGDVLLYGPQQGMGHVEGPRPQVGAAAARYTVDPFGIDSSYRRSHWTPEEGLFLLHLKRDPPIAGTSTSLRSRAKEPSSNSHTRPHLPWGLDVVRDEFGQACLVNAVDPGSPASKATFVGGMPTTARHTSGDAAGHAGHAGGSLFLKKHDMILMINGRPVGGMTEEGFQLELLTSASNLFLAVSKYKHAETLVPRMATLERSVLGDLDRVGVDDRRREWHGHQRDHEHKREDEHGTSNSRGSRGGDEATALVGRRTVAAEASAPPFPPTIPPKTTGLHSSMLGESSRQHTGDDNDDSKDTTSVPPRVDGDSFSAITTCHEDDSAAHDENPQMGCICGRKHSSSLLDTFWIQCETCHSWYHVAEKCIGFDEQQASRPDLVWNCSSCLPDTDAGSEEGAGG